jgi:hypothetical protein
MSKSTSLSQVANIFLAAVPFLAIVFSTVVDVAHFA